SASGRAPSIGEPLGRTTPARRATSAPECWAHGSQAAPGPGGVATHRAGTATRPGSAGIRKRSVDRLARSGLDRTRMWGEVFRRAGLAHPAATGLDAATSGRPRAGARRRIKKAQKERRLIVFVDESGLSERP